MSRIFYIVPTTSLIAPMFLHQYVTTTFTPFGRLDKEVIHNFGSTFVQTLISNQTFFKNNDNNCFVTKKLMNFGFFSYFPCDHLKEYPPKMSKIS